MALLISTANFEYIAKNFEGLGMLISSEQIEELKPTNVVRVYCFPSLPHLNCVNGSLSICQDAKIFE